MGKPEVNQTDNNAVCALSGDAPSGSGDYTYTPSTSCQLDDTTTYYLVLHKTVQGGHPGDYKIATTKSHDETNDPTGFGWSISNKSRMKTSATANWSTPEWDGILKTKIAAGAK